MSPPRRTASSRAARRSVAHVSKFVVSLTGCERERAAHDLRADAVVTPPSDAAVPGGDWSCTYGAVDCNDCVNDVCMTGSSEWAVTDATAAVVNTMIGMQNVVFEAQLKAKQVLDLAAIQEKISSQKQAERNLNPETASWSK